MKPLTINEKIFIREAIMSKVTFQSPAVIFNRSDLIKASQDDLFFWFHQLFNGPFRNLRTLCDARYISRINKG